jgi:Uma2 family endonuclease
MKSCYDSSALFFLAEVEMALAEPSALPENAAVGMTPEEFLRQYSDEPFVELVRGEVVPLSPTSVKHNQAESETSDQLKAFVKPGDLGVVWTGDAGFILERNPYTVRSPDVSFITKERYEKVKDLDGFFPGAPDLAVEILSLTDSMKATERKALMYLRAGASVVWILNPSDTSARVYRKDGTVQLLGPLDEIDAEPALPGFRCPVWKLFGIEEPKPA